MPVARAILPGAPGCQRHSTDLIHSCGLESVRCATYFGGEVPTLNNVLGVANARKGDSYETTNITSAGTDWEGLERQ